MIKSSLNNFQREIPNKHCFFVVKETHLNSHLHVIFRVYEGHTEQCVCLHTVSISSLYHLKLMFSFLICFTTFIPLLGVFQCVSNHHEFFRILFKDPVSGYVNYFEKLRYNDDRFVKIKATQDLLSAYVRTNVFPNLKAVKSQIMELLCPSAVVWPYM